MYNYQRIIDLSNELIAAVTARDGLIMQQKVDALDLAYNEEFGDSLDCFDAIKAFVLMNLASAKYFAHNNMYRLMQARYWEVASQINDFENNASYSAEQKAVVMAFYTELEKMHKATPERHRNKLVGRNDTRCCLCRVMPANKTGSHMVPNFLSHPTFSWDGKGKRFHEALNQDYLNAPDESCQFYGREVPEWRFAKGEGKTEITDEDIEKNISQLEYDNEFCSRCEDRFGVLESAYARFYNGQQKTINPRVAYLFWLSVLWRMSMGSMSIFMDLRDELPLRKLLNDNMLDTVGDIEESNSDLGDWRYAIFRAVGLQSGDKGILGYRKESSPYVVMYNDLVMVFYHNDPTDSELAIGPITVQRERLNDWQSPEKFSTVNRRWFWNVRDWFVESSYSFYDPVREETLRTIRERERSEDRVISDREKEEAIKEARLLAGPQGKTLRLRKMERIYGAWVRKKEAEEKGEIYDPLADDELFLQQRDFDMYFHDLAALSRNADSHDDVEKFPFYEDARKAIPDSREWKVRRPFYVRSFARIGRNDPCPCGSGKKYKHCCGKK